MTPENFAYWLQGFFELSEGMSIGDGIDEEQVNCIKEHLKLVFDKQTPEFFKDTGGLMDHSGVTEVKPEWLVRKDTYTICAGDVCVEVPDMFRPLCATVSC